MLQSIYIAKLFRSQRSFISTFRVQSSFFYEGQESQKTIKQTKMFQNGNSVCKRLHFLFSAIVLRFIGNKVFGIDFWIHGKYGNTGCEVFKIQMIFHIEN